MIEVTSKIRIFDLNGEDVCQKEPWPVIEVKSTGGDDVVMLQVAGECVTVDGYELLAAIRNALHKGRR